MALLISLLACAALTGASEAPVLAPRDGTDCQRVQADDVVNLYVSSYIGTITSLVLDGHNLSITETTPCANNASWLTWNKDDRVLYCLDEGIVVANGSVSSYKAASSGQLTPVSKQTTLSGPVSGAIYGAAGSSGDSGLALAHYGGSAVTAWETDTEGSLTPVQNITFSLAKPGPNPDRQGAPFEHETILDPTGQYIVVPDLGADLVRVFCFDPATFELAAHAPLSVPAGSGPRHGAFWKSANGTYFYLVSELANTLTGYEVTYPSSGGLDFKEIFTTGTFGDKPVPAGNAVAEIQISPDQHFIIVSNRNDSSFTLPNFNPANTTMEPSDSLATWQINFDGSVTFKQLAPAGGIFPRQFSLNSNGSLVGVGLQTSGRVVILERDIQTGSIGSPVAAIALPGQITCVVWDE